jgi:hypothetical protein
MFLQENSNGDTQIVCPHLYKAVETLFAKVEGRGIIVAHV